MKVTYVTLDPLKYPRVKKIASTLRKRSDIEFHVLTPKVRLVWYGNKMKRLVSAFINYTTFLMQIFFAKADIFWVANSPDILVLPLVLRRKRYILEYRSPWSIEVKREFKSGPWVWFSSFFERFALGNAWIITLTTSRLLGRVKDYRKPTFVIPNYPLKSFGENLIPMEQFRRHYGYDANDKVVLFVGRLTHVEGADLLPKIMGNVLRKDSAAVFWIVGDGPLYATLKAFAEKYPKRIKLFGWQHHGDISNFIRASNVCIAPRHESSFSVYYNEEGLQKISEYMFFEKPIVACGVAESSEYFLVSEDGMADGILRALRGEVPKPKRRTWEDYSEKRILEMFNLIVSGKL
jgi:glycosyltransferase involved in cell wall biosynthesis